MENIGKKISGLCLNSLKFADDMALAAESESDLQGLIHKVRMDAESRRFGLKISTAKTEVQCIATRTDPGYRYQRGATAAHQRFYIPGRKNIRHI